MFTKDHLQKILKINGLTLENSDEEIRDTLGYAKGQNLNQAISLLREERSSNTDNKNQKPDFQTNLLAVEGRLRPESIKKLLGIDMEVNYADLDEARNSRKNISVLQIFGIATCSFLFAIVVGVWIMKYYGINLLHPFV